MGYCLCSYFFGWLRDKEDKTFQWSFTWKWLWRFGIEKDALWRQVLKMKYGCVWGAGVPNLWMVLMVLVYGKISVRDGLLSHTIFCMILVMGLTWSFGKTGGVERLLLLLDILTCSDFAGIRMPVWLSLWSPPMVSSFGMWDSLGGCMIRI